jgi:hypothetical protein
MAMRMPLPEASPILTEAFDQSYFEYRAAIVFQIRAFLSQALTLDSLDYRMS